jgi:ATP-dependent DNA helicase RecG
MSINVGALIQELNETDEHNRIEAKTGTEAGKAVMKTVVAFANEPRLDGGYILFGVKRSDDPSEPRYEVVGVSDPDKVSTDFASQCASMLNRKIRPRVETQVVGGKPVVAAYVSEAQAAQKPVFIKSKGRDHGTFRRIGSSDQKCTDEDLEEIYQARSGETFDASVVASADLDDIDPAAIDDYRKTRARVNPEAEELNYSDHDLLRALRCVEKQKGELRPTVAGILLFGSKMALRRLFPSLKIDYTRVPGREWMDDPDRRYVSSVEIRAPLLQAVRRTQATIVDDLPKGFSLPEGSLQRTDTPLIPLKVLREAIVNAVMHRNYRSQGEAIHIVRYANRIEIRNPGDSLVDTEDLGAPVSKTRNPIIAGVLQDTRFAERKGTGIEVIRRNMRKAGLAPPEFSSSRKTDHFTTTLYLHHFLDADDLSWLERFKDLNLTEAEVRALIHARAAGRIDNKTYRDLNGVETLKASQDLGRLRDAGLLEMEGKGTATYYEPTEKLLGSLSSQGDLFDEDKSQTTQVEDEPSRPNGKTTQVEDETTQAEDESSKPNGKITQAEDEITQAEDETSKLGQEPARPSSGLPDHLQNVIKEWGGKSKPEKLEKIILQLCRWKPLSTVEIAEYVDRDRYHLVREYIRPLVEAGELERTRPNAPSSPNQKYRTSTDALNDSTK